MIVELAKIDDIDDNTWYEYSIQPTKGLISIILARIKGEYFAYKNSCPHQGRRLDYTIGNFLLTPSGNIVCPAHGAEFNPLNGLCVNGPCIGQSLQPILIKTNDKSVFTIIK